MAKPKKDRATPPPPVVKPKPPDIITVPVGPAIPWQPPPKPEPQPQNTLRPGEKLLPGDYLVSNNGQWKLEFRTKDGDMIVLDAHTGNNIFSTNTVNLLPGVPQLGYYKPYPLSHSWIDPYNYYCHFCEMRTDGNFLMYQGKYLGGTMPLPVVYESETSGNSNAFLRVEDDGKVAIYKFNNTLLKNI